MGYLIVLFLLKILSIHGYDNLSEGKHSIQSSTWGCPQQNCYLYAANNAVDGDISTCMRTDTFGMTSSHQTVWWRVDLGDIKSIYSIRIQFRDFGQEYYDRQRGRLAGFSLYVSNTTDIQNSYLCYKDGPELPPLDLINICSIHGRYVTFYNERNKTIYPSGYQTTTVITELCEVNVHGCQKDGFYGQNCDLACPLHCQDRRCHIIQGTCLGCTAGWIGEFCNKTCMSGYYGMECKSRCTGHCHSGASCNHVSGKCEHGCEEGWMLPNCDQPCQDGLYGPNCIYKCSNHCKNSLPCDKASGKCESCAPRYIGTLCNNSCIYGFYGENCTKTCSSFCNMRLHCNNTDGHCIKGCMDGYLEPKCDKSCNVGWYGRNCSQHCNENCINQTCDYRDGMCTSGRKAGWRTANCSEGCDNGFYGNNCLNICSNCLNNACDPFSGICIQGCTAGYIGQRCDQPCFRGWYGRNCSHLCHINCRNKSCDNVHGVCTYGCEAGWMGIKCKEECNDGRYGEDCKQICGKCAFNHTCNRTNGACLSGCAEPFTGVKCDKNTKMCLELAAVNFSDSESYYGHVIALSVVLAVSLVINMSTCLFVLRRYCQSGLEASRQYAECGDLCSTKTEDTHIYQDLNVINNDDNTYHDLSFQNTM
ncbi:multiple epidermal growth factor-like domains protein 10 [Saccostrea cucullata]|uniref:multiple epidermal growth factor-like domains protein 10 n=1 Tax=Saccostrea cuccullata TaxID=36930 RepID=UPI002ED38452